MRQSAMALAGGRQVPPPGLEEPVRRQADTIAFLADPVTHGGHRPERIDTPLSHLFLLPDDAYKLKREVHFGFVDYSTPRLRREFCERELAVNAGWGSGLYLGVLPVRETPAGLVLGEAGPPGPAVDHVVHMRRFAPGARLDRALAEDRVTPADIRRFADDLAVRHAGAPVRREAGGAAALTTLVDQLARDLAGAQPEGWPLCAISHWQEAALAAIARHRPLIERRRVSGRVRPTHGDLHLANIVFWEGRLIGFDALEFDDALRTSDLLYDLAFPVMDLVAAGRKDFASLLLSRYLARSADMEGLALMPLFLSLRAAVRALSTALAADSMRAARYGALARDFIATRPAPRLIALGGRSGTGKSTAAALIAPHLGPPPGAVVIRSDELRKILLGREPETPLPRRAYALDVSAAVQDALRLRAIAALQAGFACIVDATFLADEDREALSREARRAGVTLEGFWLEAPDAVLRTRIGARTQDASDAGPDVLALQPRAPAPTGWQSVTANGTPRQTAEAILERLGAGEPGLFAQHAHTPGHDV